MMKGIWGRLKIVLEKIVNRMKWVLFGETTGSQLELFLPLERVRQRIEMCIAEGYYLRTYEEVDEEEILNLMHIAGFDGWDSAKLRNAMHLCLPNGFFVLVHEGTNKIVAMFMARHLSDSSHPFGGRADWLAADPSHSGKGLGLVVTIAVINRLIEIGYKNIYVTTDDHRLAAIKTFLKAGFVPNLYRDDMAERWKKVCSLLDWKYQPEHWKKLKKEMESIE